MAVHVPQANTGPARLVLVAGDAGVRRVVPSEGSHSRSPPRPSTRSGPQASWSESAAWPPRTRATRWAQWCLNRPRSRRAGGYGTPCHRSGPVRGVGSGARITAGDGCPLAAPEDTGPTRLVLVAGDTGVRRVVPSEGHARAPRRGPSTRSGPQASWSEVCGVAATYQGDAVGAVGAWAGRIHGTQADSVTPCHRSVR